MLQTAGQENIAIIAVTMLLVLLGTFIVSFVLVYQRRQQVNQLEKQQLQDAFQKELLRTQLEIQEQTLKNISQEIHDNIGQALTLAKLNLNTMLPVADERLEQKIISSKELVSKSITDLRDLSHSMDTDYVREMGLQRAIEYELERIQRSGVLTTILEVDGQISKMDKQHELILFRIVQEAFNNCLKHAEATILKVFMRYAYGGISLSITDNGKGFDTSGIAEEKKGLGTRNIRSRSELIGATTGIESSPGRGTTINIHLPSGTTTNDTKQEI